MQTEAFLNQLFKKILLVVLGSGVLVNALYLFGISFYEGLTKGLGFELLIFPVDWTDGRLWAYVASREIGVSAVTVWVKLTINYILFLMLVCYVAVRVWLKIKENGVGSKEGRIRWHKRTLKSVARFKKRNPRVFSILLWLFIREDALWAFVAAYALMICVFFIPIFLLAWSFYPSFGLAYGERIGEQMRVKFDKQLCFESGEFWSPCVSVSTKHIDQAGLPDYVVGRLLFRHEKIVGIYTKAGPVTMTLPENFYQLTQRSACYMMCCPPST